MQEEQAAKLKAEKIRVALEKIKEAQVKKVGHTLAHFLILLLKLIPDSWLNRCLVTFATHCIFFVNFIHGEAAKRRENRSLQCLIMSGEGARNQKGASRCNTMQTHSTQNTYLLQCWSHWFHSKPVSIREVSLDSTGEPFSPPLNELLSAEWCPFMRRIHDTVVFRLFSLCLCDKEQLRGRSGAGRGCHVLNHSSHFTILLFLDSGLCSLRFKGFIL